MSRTSLPQSAVFLLLSMAANIAWPAYAQDHSMSAAPVQAEPPPHLIVNPPIPGPLSIGVAVIPFHTEHLKIVPIYGAAALGVVPRIGHLHMSVDGQPWHWLHTSEEPIVIQGLPAGSHSVLFELADANHKVVDRQTVKFGIPAPAAGH